MSFTSGTTGDAKGVKITNRNLLMDVESFEECIPIGRDTTIVSYLPYPHMFEQALMGAIVMKGGKIGYFSGNPANILGDCQELKPTVFPSVPRLYNKIYAKIKDGFEGATGIKKFIANQALAAKLHNYHSNATYTHGLYDMLVFNKIKVLLGGKIEFMVTGSAPIDREVLALLKVCFACPILEGYGLSETSAAANMTLENILFKIEKCKETLKDETLSVDQQMSAAALIEKLSKAALAVQGLDDFSR